MMKRPCANHEQIANPLINLDIDHDILGHWPRTWEGIRRGGLAEFIPSTAMREAIRQLAASGLIESRAHHGSIVARSSHEHLIGMFEAMAEPEALCAGLAP